MPWTNGRRRKIQTEPTEKGPDLSPEATLTRLFTWLERGYGPEKPEEDRRHGPYTTDDVQTAQIGWLVTKGLCTCTCPPYDGKNLYRRGEQHRHWFSVRGVHSRLYGGPLKFWEAIQRIETYRTQA